MLKQKVLNLMVKTGAFAPFRFFNRARTPILMYHRFSERETPFATSRRVFEEHLAYLTKHYKIISLAELAENLISGRPLPKSSAVITIDDGYRDAFEIAYPLLKKFDAPATIFAVTDFLDGKCWIWTDKARFILLKTAAKELKININSKLIEVELNGENRRFPAAGKINRELKKVSDSEKDAFLEGLGKELKVEIPELPPADFAPFNWNEAREMDGSVCRIESHSVTHPILTRITDEQLNFELNESRRRLEEKLQREMKIFCYPNGTFDERERMQTRAANYSCAVSTELRLCGANEDMFMLPRIDAEPEMPRFIQATSGFDALKKGLKG